MNKLRKDIMSALSNLKTWIASKIYQNTQQKVTGEKMQEALLEMADILSGIGCLNINEVCNHPDGYETFQDALIDVPEKLRQQACVISYYDIDGQVWIYLFNSDDISNDWEKPWYWLPIGPIQGWYNMDDDWEVNVGPEIIMKVVNNLNSTGRGYALSANQGRLLNEKIEGYDINVEEISTTPVDLSHVILEGDVITSFGNGVTQLVFSRGTQYADTIYASDLPFKAPHNYFRVATPSGTLNDVNIHVRGVINNPFINVNDINGQVAAYGSSQLARTAVPATERILGLQITYLLADGWFSDQYIGADISGWGTESNWKVLGPVTVSQNTETGKKEMHIGAETAFIVDNEPEVDSENLVKSGGVQSYAGGPVISPAVIEHYKFFSTNKNVTKSGESNTYITVDESGLYEIDFSINFSSIIGNDEKSITTPIKTYFPYVYQGKKYVFISEEDFINNVKYLVIPGYNSSNITNVCFYQLLGTIINVVKCNETPTQIKRGVKYLPYCGGVFTNFGNIEVYEDELCLMEYDGANWQKRVYGYLNTFNIPFLPEPHYITSTGEVQTNNSAFNSTDKIYVKKGDVIICQGYATSAVSKVAGYSTNGEFLRNLYPVNGNTYGRIEIMDDDISYVVISLANNTHTDYVKRFAGIIFKDVNINEINNHLLTTDAHIETARGDIYENIATLLEGDIPFDKGNTRIVAANGNESTNTNYVDTGFIKVEPFDEVYYSGYVSSSSYACVGGYSAANNANYVICLLAGVGDSDQYDNKKIVIPEGISYIKASCRTNATKILLRKATIKINNVVVGNRDRIVELESKISSFKGKKIAVIGDSISTGLDMNPYWEVKTVDIGNEIQSYVTFWDVYSDIERTPTGKTIGGTLLTEAMVGTLQTFTPVTEDVGKQIGVALTRYNNNKGWAYQLCEKLGATLINASWSGASMCNGQGSVIYQPSCGWSDYTIERCRMRDDNGDYVNPDVVIIYRGVNDFSHEQGGNDYAYLDANYSLEDNGYPTTDVIESGKYGFFRAYYMSIKKIRETYPNAVIYCCTLNVFKRITYDRFPTRNGQYSLPQMNDAIRAIANTMGCGLIEFDKDGISFENCYSEGYLGYDNGSPTHPTSKGMSVLLKKALHDLSYNL